jgi:hypothetical protein
MVYMFKIILLKHPLNPASFLMDDKQTFFWGILLTKTILVIRLSTCLRSI